VTPTVHPITPGFAAEIGDLDLARPLGDAAFEIVRQAFWTYAVLVFPDQHLSADQHLAFARRFGPLESTSGAQRFDAALRTPPEIADVSNLDATDRIWGGESRLRMLQMGNRVWHTDSSFKRVPALASLLHARSIPPVGGLTEFADLRAAWDALPEATQRRARGRVALHSVIESRARLGFTDFSEAERRLMPPVPQVLVRTIPQSGRTSLYLSSHATRVQGMPDAEGRALIDGLVAHATQRQFVYTHRWRVGDLVMWDDRCTLHRGTAFDDLRFRRDMQRATVSDVANTCEQEGVPAAT